jgi:hypothetical protein
MTLYYLGKRKPATINVRVVPPTPTYDDLVASFGSSVVSYWRFAGTGIDEKGVANATFTGLPEVVPTIVQRDTIAEGAQNDGTCIAWSGSTDEYAEAAHNAAHATAAGTICCTFQCDTLAENANLVSKAAGTTIGAIGLSVLAAGAPRIFLRNASGVSITRVGQNGDVVLNRAYTMFAKWGSGGLELSIWDNLALIRRVPEPSVTDGLSGNASAIRFGVWHTDVERHDGPFGRVIWFNRRLTEAEEAILALPKTILHGQGIGEFITTPEANGWADTNTVAQNRASFQAAIDSASANALSSASGRGVVELIQGKSYTLGTTNGALSAASPCLIARNNIEIRTGGKPNRTSGFQASIAFESWAGKSGVHNQCLLLIQSVSNVVIGWVTFDGSKNTLTSPTSINYTQGQNGGLSNIIISTGASNLALRETLSRNALTDGVLFTDQLAGIGANTFLIEDCTFSRNRRAGITAVKMGLSGGAVDHCTFRRCTFADNGDFSGDVVGQKPGNGVTFSTGIVGSNFDGVALDGCAFLTNRGTPWDNGVNTGVVDPSGFGLQVDSAAPVRRLKLVTCTLTNNRTNIQFQARGDQTFNQLTITDLTSVTASVNARLTFLSNGTDVGVVTSTTITNANVPEILFATSLRNTGHSVTIWRGSFAPLVTTNAQTTITNNAGLPGSGDVVIFQSDETDTIHPIGQQHPGLFSIFGSALNAFRPTECELALAPDGARAYRLMVPNGNDGGVSFRWDTVAAWNGGAPVVNAAMEAEIYVPSISPGVYPGLDKRGYYGPRLNGWLAHDSLAGESSVGADTPRMNVLDRDFLANSFEAYVYFENKTTSFGTTFGGTATPAFRLRDHLNEWIVIRMECRGGHGNLNGTFRYLINGVERDTNSGMRYHFTAGLGWRGVGLSHFLHDLNTTGAPAYCYVRRLKMIRLS